MIDELRPFVLHTYVESEITRFKVSPAKCSDPLKDYKRLVLINKISDYNSSRYSLSKYVDLLPSRSTMIGIEVCDKRLVGIKNLRLVTSGLQMVENFPMEITDSMTLLLTNSSNRKICLRNGNIIGTIKEGPQHSLETIFLQ